MNIGLHIIEGTSIKMVSAYSKQDGSYIGKLEDAYSYIKRFGITEFYTDNKDHKVCSIGFNPVKKLWYGWSHRATMAFAIGDYLFDVKWKIIPGDKDFEKYQKDSSANNISANNIMDIIPFKRRGFKKIETLEEARQAAINFAEYVG